MPTEVHWHIDVFGIVNRLRKDRDKMIEDFNTYKLLFRCINNYGLNRQNLMQSNQRFKRSEPLNVSTPTTEEMGYQAYEGHHRYQNIEEMSEYL